METTYLAIDAGTTAVKIALFDHAQRTLYADEAPVSVLRGPQGEAETDMELYWRTICTLTARAADACDDAFSALGCVCAAGQGDGLWPLDRQGRCFMNAILWQDTRPAACCGGEALPRLEREHHCNRLLPGTRGAILSWLRRHCPADYDRVHYPLSCVSFINFRLSGAAAADESSCGDCFDILAGAPVPALYDALGIGDMAAKLPPVYPCDAPMGTVSAWASAQSRIPAGVPVLTGCLDATAAVLGRHPLRPGTASVCAGTALLVMCPRQNPPVFPLPEGVYADRVPYEPPLYRLCFAPVSGASAIAAAKERFFPNLSYEEMYRGIERIPTGSEGLIYLPFLYGERSPFYCPGAQAGFHGAGPGHTRWHRMRAAAEGVLFAARHCLDAAGPSYSAVELTGGASRSPVFCQMAADIFGLPVHTSQGVYAGTEGCLALMLRRQGEALRPAEDELPGYQPRAENRRAAEAAYHQYRDVLDALLPRWRSGGEKERS